MTFHGAQLRSSNSPSPPSSLVQNTANSATSLTVPTSTETTNELPQQEEQQTTCNNPPVASKLTTTPESAMPFSDVTASNAAYTSEGNSSFIDVGFEIDGRNETEPGPGIAGMAMSLSLLSAKGAVGPNGLLSKTKTHLSSSPTPGNSKAVTPVGNAGDSQPAINYFSERSTAPSSPGTEIQSGGNVTSSAYSNGVSVKEDVSASYGSESSTLEGLGRVSKELKDQIIEFLDTNFEDPSMKRVQKRVKESMDIIGEALQKYCMPTLSLSFNGGKDCLLLLVLLLASLPQPATHPLQTIYVPPVDPFPAVTTFVHDCVKTYHLHLVSYPIPMQPAFSAYIEEHPWIKAVFVGTRRTDPHGGSLHAFEETDGDWAKFTRVNPVLEWEYDEVWKFLNWGKWKICELYEQGYTSLGGLGDTVENPALKVTEEDGRVWYKPAWDLEDGGLERAGRGRSK